MPLIKSFTGWYSFFCNFAIIHSTSIPCEKFFSSLEVIIRTVTDLSATISSSIAFSVWAKTRFCLFSLLVMVRIATVSSLAQVMIDIYYGSFLLIFCQHIRVMFTGQEINKLRVIKMLYGGNR